MARRRISKGSMRIDAALDAMRQLGFPAPIVRKSIRKLLKVYGTDEAWIAIEENSYQLLVDNIIEEQEEEDKLIKVEEQRKSESHKIVEEIQEEDCETVNSLLSKAGKLLTEEVKLNEAMQKCNSAEASVLPPVLDHLPAAPKRKPSYGWISEGEDEDDDEDDDFVILTPAKRLC